MRQKRAIRGLGWTWGQSFRPKEDPQVMQNGASSGDSSLQSLQSFIAFISLRLRASEGCYRIASSEGL